MALHLIPLEQIQASCRSYLTSFEMWTRRLIHLELSRLHGENYFFEGKNNGNNLINTKIQQYAKDRLSEELTKSQIPVNLLLFDHIIDILCNPELFKLYFQEPLKEAFPDGHAEARTFLERLVPIRNALSHAREISIHQAERVFCYCDDVIGSIKIYYKGKNLEQEYNTPLITGFRDSVGNTEILTEPITTFSYSNTFRPGEHIRWEVEVDTSFDKDSYTVTWRLPDGTTVTGLSCPLTFELRHVMQQFSIHVEVKSIEEYHRLGTVDAYMQAQYKVLPPLD